MCYSFPPKSSLLLHKCQKNPKCSPAALPIPGSSSLGLPLHSSWLFQVLTCLSSTVELQQKDRALVERRQEKVGLFAEMTHFQVEEDGGSGVPLPTLPRGLFRSESLESPRGERLLQDAIREGEGASGEESGLTSSPSHNRDTWLDKGNVHPIVRNSPKCLLGAGCQEWGKMALATVCHLSSCTPLGTLMIFSSYVVLALRPHYLCRGHFPRCLHVL